jgi:nucleotide-binding universal stress UspA family protein
MTNTPAPIVVAVDGSEESRRALEMAVDEANAHGEPLHIVTVIDITPAVLHLPHDQQVNTADIAKERQEEVWAEVDDIDTGEVEVERVGLTGTPPDELTNYCDEVNATLVVVGNRGRGRVRGFLGSTSKRLLEKAPCPVLVVR